MTAYQIINDIEHQNKDQVVRNLVSWLTGKMEVGKLKGLTEEEITVCSTILEYIDNLLLEEI